MKFLCECDSSICLESVEFTLEDWNEIKLKDDHYVISNDCPHGPEDTDILVEKKENYSIYKGV